MSKTVQEYLKCKYKFLMTSEKFKFKYKNNPHSTSFFTSLTGLKFVGKFRGIRFLFSWLCVYMKTAKSVCDTSKILQFYTMPISLLML